MAWLQSLHWSFLLAAAALMVAAAVHDARSFKIPNWIWLSMLALFPLYVLSATDDVAWPYHLGVFVLVFTIGFVLFAGHFAGAGDIKLLAAASLWAGPNFIGVLLVVTGLAGGVLAFGYALRAWFKNRAHGAAEPGGAENGLLHAMRTVAIPYGIAIAVGGISSFGMMLDQGLS
ncbi:MAG: prepilin peptidase [Alphaproteobacteria bacterium]